MVRGDLGENREGNWGNRCQGEYWSKTGAWEIFDIFGRCRRRDVVVGNVVTG